MTIDFNIPETFSELKSDYLKEGLMPPEKLYRRDAGGERYYLRMLDKMGLSWKLGIGLTTVLKQIVAVDEEYLRKWEREIGIDQATMIGDRGMCFGTIGHKLIAKFCQDGAFDFGIISEFVREEIPLRFLETELTYWQQRMRKAMASVAQWFSDYSVIPHFVEYPTMDDVTGVTHYHDFKGEAKFKTGYEPIHSDWKFTKGAQFYELHFAQGSWAGILWNNHCERRGMDEKVTRSFLFAPKDYRKTGEPTYNFHECTDNYYAKNFDSFMKIWMGKKEETMKKLPSKEIYPHGKYAIGKGEIFTAKDHYSEINYTFL